MRWRNSARYAQAFCLCGADQRQALAGQDLLNTGTQTGIVLFGVANMNNISKISSGLVLIALLSMLSVVLTPVAKPHMRTVVDGAPRR